MYGITRTAPARELNLLRREMDRLFNDFTTTRRNDTEGSSVWMPRADLAEREDACLLTLDLPGLSPDDVGAALEGDTLTITGERQASSEQRDGRFHRVERQYGRFCRTVQFATPIAADDVAATFEDGVLTLRIPKAEASKPRRIAVQGRANERASEGDGHAADVQRVEVNAPEQAA